MHKLTHRAIAPALLLALAVLALGTPRAGAQDGGDDAEATAASAAAAAASQMEFKAASMVRRGVELMNAGQDERGLKLLLSVPQNYPKSKARFDAWLNLGKYYIKKNDLPKAINVLTLVKDTRDDQQEAEAIYQLGICHYKMDQFNEAFMAFRKVTNEFPFSVFANEAYYYIGQCHFKLDRWSKALEALEMVGTSVPPNQEGVTKSEAGQRLYTKVFDKDFPILAAQDVPIEVQVRAESGDVETIGLEKLGRSGEHYIGSLRTEPGNPQKGDGTLQYQSSEKVQVTYTDQNTEAGEVDQRTLAETQLVSTATVGFTNGAYNEYVKGVFAGQDCFIRVKDSDLDATGKPDRVTVDIRSEKTVLRHSDAQEEDTDLEAPEKEIIQHDEITLELVETGNRTGVFHGTFVPQAVSEEQVDSINTTDNQLMAQQGDSIVLTYVDELHMQSNEPRTLESKAQLLVGQMQDVKIVHRVPDKLRDKARKNLLEGKIFLKLGQIFRDVGLKEKAAEKADVGLNRIADVMAMREAAALERETIEEAYSVKWELLLVKERLGEAIAVCRELMALYPDSSLVDRALFNIAMARKEAGELSEARGIFAEITKMKESELAAEAQFRIAEIIEAEAIAKAKEGRGESGPEILAGAMAAYRQCAEKYPDSPYAGDALEKVAQYYIDTKDYPRAVELMERVFLDYQDADFLPKMLVKWIIVAMRMGDKEMAREKAQKLMTDYPKMAEKAREYIRFIERM